VRPARLTGMTSERASGLLAARQDLRKHLAAGPLPGLGRWLAIAGVLAFG